MSQWVLIVLGIIQLLGNLLVIATLIVICKYGDKLNSESTQTAESNDSVDEKTDLKKYIL